jgi:sugar-phosphatase
MKSEIAAVIFDMDGLIIDSEPLWRKAEIETFKDIGFDFTESMCIETMGMRIDQVVHYWWKQLKWSSPSEKEVVDNIQSKMVKLINKEGVLLPGVLEAINLLHSKNIPIALASSSSMKLITTVLDKLQIKSFFSVIHSAEKEKAGKPDPAVFLTTAKLLNIEPSKCLVLEDSKAGLNAGLNAGMRTILIPEKKEDIIWQKKSFKVLNTMKDFNFNYLK